jgi:uncharacterized RDD family membrane protein YckC
MATAARPAGFPIRAAAAAIDAAAAWAAALALASSLGIFFARRAVVTLRIGEPGTLWTGPIPLLLGIVGEVVYLLPFVLLLAWSLDPLTGATIGKRLAGLRVCGRDGRPASRGARWRRGAIQTAGLWGSTIALLAGRWEILVLAALAGLILLAGTLLALGPASLTLHDRLSGTRVCRVRGPSPNSRNSRRHSELG